jgi:hypothetical protein
MATSVLPQPGRAYSFRYPRHNYRGVPCQLEVRCVLVTCLRDTRRDRLDPETLNLNPLLRRSRWLLIGEDLDKGAERSFYVDSIHDLRPLVPEDRTPYRDAEYLVLSPRGHTEYATAQYGESLAFLQGRRWGMLCKVLVCAPTVER